MNVTPAKALRKGQRVLTCSHDGVAQRAIGTDALAAGNREVAWTEPVRVGGKGWTLVHFVDGTEIKSPSGASWIVL